MKEMQRQRAAQAAGYPATLFGYGPEEDGYWLEPDLPWLNGLEQLPYGLRLLVDVDTDAMAPRFPPGAVVGVEGVERGQPLPSGVYVWKHPADTSLAFHMGRLEQAQPSTSSLLILSLDNRPYGLTCRLEWNVLGFRLYRVTHYASLPAE